MSFPSYADGFAESQDESANPGLWTGLVGLWAPSLGPTGLTVFDWSGRGNRDGTLTNMDPATDWVPSGDSRLGWALDFDATDEHINLGTFLPIVPFSVVAWVRTNTIATTQSIFSVVDASVGDQRLVLALDASTQQIGVLLNTAGSNDWARTTTSYSANQWHQVVAVFAASNDRRVYIDGGSVGTNSVDGSPTGLDTASIGMLRDSTPSSPFDGLISTVAVYDGILSPSVIADLFTNPNAILQLRSRNVAGVTAAPAVGNPWYQYAQETAVAG